MKTEAKKLEIDTEVAAQVSDLKLANRPTEAKSSSLNVGIIGAGLMGKWHARYAEKAGGEILGIIDTDKNKALQLAKKHSKAKAFSDFKEMLESDFFDVLHICTPTASHFGLAESALRRGINLFIEKPLALTAAKTSDLFRLAKQNNAKICPAHQFPFQQCVKSSKENWRRLGKVVHLAATICSAGAVQNIATESFDSVAVDILPHPVSLFQAFLNVELLSTDWNILRASAGEFRITGCIDEISLSIFISMNSRPTVNSFEIYGKRGTAHLNLFHDFAVIESGNVSKGKKILNPFSLAVKSLYAASSNLVRRSVRFEPAYPGLFRLISEFYRSVREDAPSPVTPRQTIEIARIRDLVIERSGIN